ncbi:MAG: DUF58 domain-containing protein [Methylococcaceae bacterium]
MTIQQRIKNSRFFMGEQANDAAITLTHKRVFILPTQRGLGFCLLLLLLLLIAFVYNNNLAYLLTFLLASIFFLTIIHTVRSLFGLILQRGQSKPVFAGEAAGFEIHLTNPSSTYRHNILISLEDTQSLTLSAHSKNRIILQSLTHKRGWHEAGKVVISSTFPLGLFRAWSPLRFNLKVLVYPKPASKEIAFPESDSGDIQQGFTKKGVDDFYGLQEYQVGDSIKHIHWKAFAKGLGVFSKQFSGTSSSEIWLDYDYALGHNTEERLSQLCRWVIDAERSGIRYGFILPNVKLAPNNGLEHYQACLQALALF